MNSKQLFLKKKDALTALNYKNKASNLRKKFEKVYYCTQCKGWHITSNPRKKILFY